MRNIRTDSPFNRLLSEMIGNTEGTDVHRVRLGGGMNDIRYFKRTTTGAAPGSYEGLTAQSENPQSATRHAEIAEMLAGGISAICDALGMRSGCNAAELHRLRRDFARKYHPDTQPPQLRRNAEKVMRLANSAVDAALAAGRAKR